MPPLFRQFLLVLHRVEDGVLVMALLTMLSVALVQIVLRNVFDTGIAWADPFVRVLILWVTMLGAMAATRERSHITIDAVSRYLGPMPQLIARTLTALFAAAICGTAAWYTWEFLQFEREDGMIAFGVVPVWICQLILPVGFGVMAVRFVVGAFLKPAGQT